MKKLALTTAALALLQLAGALRGVLSGLLATLFTFTHR